MSVSAMSWAFEQFLPANEKLVLLVLADCENGQTHVCNPGQEYIAQQASMTSRTVRTMLTKLEERKLITRTRRSSETGRKTDSYILHRPGRPAAATPPIQQPEDLSGSTQPENLSGSATGKIKVPNRKAASGPRNRKLNQKNPPTPQGGPVIVEEDDHRMFDQLWDAYPKHEDRNAALQEWYRVVRTGTSQLELIIAARSHAEHVRVSGTDLRFVKTLANWLRAGSYDNAPPPTPKSPYPKLKQVPR